jgi:hypothetical protein
MNSEASSTVDGEAIAQSRRGLSIKIPSRQTSRGPSTQSPQFRQVSSRKQGLGSPDLGSPDIRKALRKNSAEDWNSVFSASTMTIVTESPESGRPESGRPESDHSEERRSPDADTHSQERKEETYDNYSDGRYGDDEGGEMGGFYLV